MNVKIERRKQQFKNQNGAREGHAQLRLPCEDSIMMKTSILCVLLYLTFTTIACQSSASQRLAKEEQKPEATPVKQQESTGRQWQPATYRGLRMGQATRADMLRVFGKPREVIEFDENMPTAGTNFFYRADGDIAGEVVVAVDKRTDKVFSIELRPKSLSKEGAIRYFGDNYIVTRYAFDECLRIGDGAPMYESQSGNLVNTEYRERGIAIVVNSEGMVDYIMYVSEPIGARSSKCLGTKQIP